MRGMNEEEKFIWRVHLAHVTFLGLTHGRGETTRLKLGICAGRDTLFVDAMLNRVVPIFFPPLVGSLLTPRWQTFNQSTMPPPLPPYMNSPNVH